MADDETRYLTTGRGDPDDRERLDALREVLSEEDTWAVPPDRVGEGILERVKAKSRRPRKRARRWMPAVALLGTLFVLVIAAAAGLLAPGERMVALEGTDLEAAASAEAEIRPAGSGWWIGLQFQDLPAAPQGSYYEGWLWNEKGHGVSIGTFHLADDSEKVILWSGVDPAEYPAISITLEREDGNPAASGEVVLRGRVDR